jgi:polygalacturonase
MFNRLLSLLACCFAIAPAIAQQKQPLHPGAIGPAPGAPHIARINGDTVVVITGSTYSYAVDTPEGQGLVSTNPGVTKLITQLNAKNGGKQVYEVTDAKGVAKKEGAIVSGDRLVVTIKNNAAHKNYYLLLQEMALSGSLQVKREASNTPGKITVYFTAGQRSPDATVRITTPAGFLSTMENTTVNVIGRGDVLLKDLAKQSIGRVGANYPYSKVGDVAITRSAKGGSVITFTHLDLRPANGPDLVLTINNVTAKPGQYAFSGQYTTAAPAVLSSVVTNTITDLKQVSNTGKKTNVRTFNIPGEDNQDVTDAINIAILALYQQGGGTLLFPKGTYPVRTIHLKSNVWLHLEEGAVIKALKGTDAPETTWFSDCQYRSGLSPTDDGPYTDPENYLTKQDVGHHYFHNAMFFAEREDNIKITGNGRITGDGNLVTGDKVMNNTPDNRGDKMFVFKLCTNIEIGGLKREEDLWYDSTKDEPYYITKSGGKDFNTSNMLQIDQAGHFVLLATGTDNLYVHDTYFGKYNTSHVRDIYDFMGCNNVTATNIYCKISSDDIIKPGSDCSLGFTRPASNYKVRNVIGDTNCNLFQIGSETADDIMDVHVDNIYVLGANKAGFSISTNDGGHIKDIHLNCGHTGPLHSRSLMYRATTPFFISISNRGRIIGASVGKYAFTDNGEKHNELLVKNVNIGQVENIILNSIDVYEVYSGSSFSGKMRWKAYDGTQKRSSPIVAGYQLPDAADVTGGLDFKLPNGQHTGYIQNIVFNDVHVLVKGGNPLSDTTQTPPELGVGQYNASNLKVQPSFGLWARHAKGLTVTNCSFNYEQPDGRYPVYLDDVLGAKFSNVKMEPGKDNPTQIKTKKSTDLVQK